MECFLELNKRGMGDSKGAPVNIQRILKSVIGPDLSGDPPLKQCAFRMAKAEKRCVVVTDGGISDAYHHAVQPFWAQHSMLGVKIAAAANMLTLNIDVADKVRRLRQAENDRLPQVCSVISNPKAESCNGFL